MLCLASKAPALSNNLISHRRQVTQVKAEGLTKAFAPSSLVTPLLAQADLLNSISVALGLLKVAPAHARQATATVHGQIRQHHSGVQ